MSTFTSAPVFNTQVMGDFNTKPIITVSHGGHSKHSGQACLMEWVSIFTEDDFGDAPKCTNVILASLARRVNDTIGSDSARSSLATRISQLAGTAVPPVHPARFIVPVWAELVDNPIPKQALVSGGWGNLVRLRIHGITGTDSENYDLREAGLRILQEASRETPSLGAWENVISKLIEATIPRGDDALIRALDTAIRSWQEAADVTAKPLSNERLKELRARAEKLWADAREATANIRGF